ncbi:Wadjet anti-phage system protein JetA family protein [Gynuella sunshinyii]|uniref:Flagellar protein FliT n=1 Tax=Gynuella sunshinyii YC6258 TaxID=1445510 RepID=A0A0C5W1P9_9GAMM|nr:Wadjet anti-phage system protein JetA family protein [Gynuella sunshinyii]AJQ96604.1 hypothetical Protein YC6258_04572 [Gynuella sunshinyii YC6258]
MFFEQPRAQFFKPLTSKYREQVVECLRELYLRLYSASHADYGQALQRDNLIEIFQEALERAPVLADDSDESTGEQRFRNSREQAGWILNSLLEYGWLERQVDEATLQSTYAFSRFGRQFTEPFIASERSARTRHRNTRGTYNSLSAFLSNGEVYDLLDAFEYSERIIADFTDVITELDDRRRELVKDMETQMLVQKASDEFFDFMEKRFQPDLSIRLSADSVEKFRDRIEALIQKIRKKDRAFKTRTEQRLRELLPDQIVAGQSLLWSLLDGIEYRIRAASDVMVPQLRRALQSFTKRADIIIRQMSYLSSQQHNDLVSICKRLSELPAQEQGQALLHAGEIMAVPRLGYVDPQQVRLAAPRRRLVLAMDIDSSESFDVEARKDIYIQQLLDQAFFISDQTIRDYLYRNLLAGHKVDTRQLPVETARDLLSVSHAIEVGAASNLSTEFRFQVTPVENETHENEYFARQDVFEICLVTNNQE